ncbi:MAG: hypothetical protein CME19_02295 [Gemmatimonadetes bacterium]|nr:hypothetical protein [Gemmatimonadota bacterium]|tara:strand:+ start:389 stop:1099 length:711 start_codon:yes stop_codon:yes gene_type:complete
MLSIHQINHFRQIGYLVLPTRLDTSRVERLKAKAWEDVKGEVDPVVRDSDERVHRISALFQRDTLFLETASCPDVIEPLADLLGPNIEVLTNRHNHLTLNYASQQDDFHRDNLQWSRSLLTVIFYLETTTIENGCTQIVPGSHMYPGVEVHHRLSSVDWVRDSGLLDQAVHVPVQAGQMMAINSMIFHRIGANSTGGTRMSMTVGYTSVDEFSDAQNPKRILVAGERIYGGNDKAS